MRENIKHYLYEEIYVGQLTEFIMEITEAKMKMFCEITGDINPLHTDSAYAVNKGFKEKVVYGMLTASFLSSLAGMWLPGEHSIILGVELEFPNPVYLGDVLSIEGIVKEKNDNFNLILLAVTARNQEKKKVLRGKMRIQVKEKN